MYIRFVYLRCRFMVVMYTYVCTVFTHKYIQIALGSCSLHSEYISMNEIPRQTSYVNIYLQTSIPGNFYQTLLLTCSFPVHVPNWTFVHCCFLSRSGEPTFLPANYVSLLPSQNIINTWTANGLPRPYLLSIDSDRGPTHDGMTGEVINPKSQRE